MQAFLAKEGLPAEPLTPDVAGPAQTLPSWATPEMQDAFAKFLKLGPYKAFAVSSSGGWGYASGKKTPKLADDEALDRCRSSSCQVIARDKR